MSGYSADMLKRAAFIDEMTNVLGTKPPEYQTEEYLAVVDYIAKRIKQIEKEYSSV